MPLPEGIGRLAGRCEALPPDVFIRGGKAIYFRKNGDFHSEPFPRRE
jgi:hypothetical protein